MADTFKLAFNLPLIIRELGLQPGDVLRRAAMSMNTFTRGNITVTEDEYFRLWNALEAELGERSLPLEVGRMLTFEAFDPAIFAALCSSDLNQAAKRLSQYKRLIGPFKLDVETLPDQTRLTFSSAGPAPLPTSIGMMEHVFFVQYTRRATRTEVIPERVEVTDFPENKTRYEDFLGVRMTKGSRFMIAFSAQDASRPFLTANAEMWNFFEPVLKQRLAELSQSSSTSKRVHAALFEMLPGGRSSIDDIASTLGMSKRSLQRRLNEEHTSFKQILNETREQLAIHYLSNSSMTFAEISFLLGFEEPNSFSRAFRSWTGQTPQRMRASMLN